MVCLRLICDVKTIRHPANIKMQASYSPGLWVSGSTPPRQTEKLIALMIGLKIGNQFWHGEVPGVIALVGLVVSRSHRVDIAYRIHRFRLSI